MRRMSSGHRPIISFLSLITYLIVGIGEALYVIPHNSEFFKKLYLKPVNY